MFSWCDSFAGWSEIPEILLASEDIAKLVLKAVALDLVSGGDLYGGYAVRRRRWRILTALIVVDVFEARFREAFFLCRSPAS